MSKVKLFVIISLSLTENVLHDIHLNNNILLIYSKQYFTFHLLSLYSKIIFREKLASLEFIFLIILLSYT